MHLTKFINAKARLEVIKLVI